MTTFYICPACGTFWSKERMPADPTQRHNGGVRACSDCRHAQWAYDDEREEVRR